MQTATAREARALDDRDIRSILTRNSVGRLAYAQGGRVEIRPIHYVYRDGVVYGCAVPTAALDAPAALPPSVAFEVDEIDTVHRWRTVVLQGELDVLPAGGEPADDASSGAIRRLRRLAREAPDGGAEGGTCAPVLRIRVRRASGCAMR